MIIEMQIESIACHDQEHFWQMQLQVLSVDIAAF